MKKKLIVLSLFILVSTLLCSFLVPEGIIKHLKDVLSIISGITSFVVMLIAILLYNKYGVDKSIKDKNLEISLKLLEELKTINIGVWRESFGMQHRITTFSIDLYESHYGTKLLFPKSYYDDLNHIFAFSNNLYLPKSIKEKLDNIIPYILTPITQEIDQKQFGKVSINLNKDVEYGFYEINNEQLTVFEYLVKWDELVTSIQEWCNKNAETKLDLNLQ